MKGPSRNSPPRSASLGISVRNGADHPHTRKHDPGPNLERDRFDRDEAERAIEGLANQAGVALEPPHARCPRLGGAAREQRTPDAVPEPVRMGCEMPDVTKAAVERLARRTRALKRPAATAHLGPLWPLGKIVGPTAQERRMGSRHQGNGAGEEIGWIAGRH